MEIAETLADMGTRDWETASPDGTVRMAVIGLGGFASEHALPGIANGDYAETTVMVSGSAEKAERWAREWDARRGITYEEFHDGAATDDYDAVYVVTPNALHLDFVRSAAEHGKHVICEKPLEASHDRAEALVEACDAAGVKLMTAYRLQTEPAIRRVRDLVVDGIVGDLVSFHGEFAVRSLRGDRSPDHWRYDGDLAGGGAMLDIGVYPLNTGRFVLDRDPIAVAGTTASPDPVFADVDEHVAFQLEFSDGASGLCSATFNGQPGSFLEIVGVDGRVRVNDAFPPRQTRTVTVETSDGRASVQGPGVDELAEQFDYFAYHVLTDGDIEPDGTDGLIDMAVAAGVYESAETGDRVSL